MNGGRAIVLRRLWRNRSTHCPQCASGSGFGIICADDARRSQHGARRHRERLEERIASLRNVPKTETDELAGALQAASNHCVNIGKDLEKMESKFQQKTGEIGFEVVAWADAGSVERKYVLFLGRRVAGVESREPPHNPVNPVHPVKKQQEEATLW